MKNNPSHDDQLIGLKRIEGQIRGLQKMVEERRYCIDIMTQLSSVIGALLRVQNNVLERHLHMCITSALKGKSDAEKQIKINEILALIKRFRKNS